MTLCYYNAKDNTFHEKDYDYKERAQCAKDYKTLKRMKVPFFYANAGLGFSGFESNGLGFGKEISMEELPTNIYNVVDEWLEDLNSHEYGGKREFDYGVYESDSWYGVWADLGEDDFENEVEFNMFITKDGTSKVIC